MVKQALLRWLLEGGHSLDVVMEEHQARKFVTDWQANSLQDRVGGVDTQQKRSWAVDVRKVLCVFTMDLDILKREMEQRQRGGHTGYPWGSSG
jgi:hypothetical protein